MDDKIKMMMPPKQSSELNVLLSFSRKLFEFHSKLHWVNKAQGWFANCGVPKHRYIAVDSAGRVCTSGKEFMRAEEENTYPVSVYEI